MSINRATLRRIRSANDGTFGIMSVGSQSWFSLEKPWRENESGKSCIPAGTYQCTWTKWYGIQRWTYQVLNVPKRTGIMIHSANFETQLLGCIALGMSYGVMDGKHGVFSSQTAIRQFNKALEQKDFTLEII